MKSGRCLYAGAVVVALVIAFGLWNPIHVKADHDRDRHRTPRFRVDPFWPKPLPAPVGYNFLTWPTPNSSGPFATTANSWVMGEVAASCIDQFDNVYTFNRGWEVGVRVGGVVQNNQSGNIVTQDATGAHAEPSPPVVAFDPDGRTILSRSFGNPALWTDPNHGAYTGTSPGATFAVGRSAYLPNGAHGCFVDYTGNLWLGGNADGVVQKYNPAVAGPMGASATYSLQIGNKDFCDTTTGICGANPDANTQFANNSSHVLLNEPPDMAVDPDVGPVSGKTGDIYIADGYGNYRVVVFDRDGNYVGQWGQPCVNGTSTGVETPNGTDTPDHPCPANSFGVTGGGHPHCVVLGNDGNVYLCDRPNGRIIVIGKTSDWIQPSTGSGCTSVPAGPCTPPTPAMPKRVIYVGTNGSTFPDSANPAKVAAIRFVNTRACDIDFYPNVDYLASDSPRQQKYIIDVVLDADVTVLMDKASGNVLSAFGRCGIAPCPGHNAGEFAYNHTTVTDSKGDVYIAETITGRRIQKFLKVEEEERDHHKDHD